jgi:polysaccharide biosynthesis/export protein
MRFACYGPQVCAAAVLTFIASGCASHAIDREIAMAVSADMPRELNKVSHPPYRVEPPDILLIEAVNNIRPADSPLEAGDRVTIRLQKGLKITPDPTLDPVQDAIEYQFELEREISSKIVNGEFLIGADGTVDLGPIYGKAVIAGLTLEEARDALVAHFQNAGINEPSLAVTLPDVAGKQPVQGEHLVRPDGTVSLGIYGQVYVAGLTLPEVKAAVENHLSPQMHEPQVSVDVQAYNSKKIYVIMDGGGYGEQVIPLPCTGNETVLDAIAQLEGLSQVSSKKIWISRPAPSEYECAQTLDVHWRAITQEGITTTNYQLFPGDKVYVEADHLIATDNALAKLFSPLERTLGVISLGTGTAKAIKFFDRFQGGGGP